MQFNNFKNKQLIAIIIVIVIGIILGILILQSDNSKEMEEDHGTKTTEARPAHGEEGHDHAKDRR
jgi:uncharacterized protein YpmB